ncbi:hypothetical protein BRD03_11860 [Halobacteriales archaeon QS_9_68_17]|nr:MAG: hypothetical protein BRD03_11860 [Halobacteriales archaeon QS_9_68_17]
MRREAQRAANNADVELLDPRTTVPLNAREDDYLPDPERTRNGIAAEY